MECPFSEDQFVNTKREELEERAFQEAMAALKRKIDRIQSVADLSNPEQQAAAQQDTREQQPRTPYVADKMPGRNDPCPCGSGKKFKNCHGRGLV